MVRYLSDAQFTPCALTRLQLFLLCALVALASFALAQAAWSALAPLAPAAVGLGAAALAAVPAWVWHTLGWTAFSAIWWLPCALGGRRCAPSSCRPATS